MALYRTHNMQPPIDLTKQQDDMTLAKKIAQEVYWRLTCDIYEDDLQTSPFDGVLFPVGRMQ